MASPRIVSLLLAALLAPAQQQAPDKTAASIAAARKALAEGKREGAFDALRTALGHSPFSQEALQLCVEASKPDDDAQSFWLHTLARATLGPERSNTLDSNGRRLLGNPDSKPVQLAAAYCGRLRRAPALRQGARGRGRLARRLGPRRAAGRAARRSTSVRARRSSRVRARPSSRRGSRPTRRCPRRRCARSSASPTTPRPAARRNKRSRPR